LYFNILQKQEKNVKRKVSFSVTGSHKFEVHRTTCDRIVLTTLSHNVI